MSILDEASRVRDYEAMVAFNKALSTFANRCPEQAKYRLEEALRDLREGKLPREYPVRTGPNMVAGATGFR